MGFPADDDLPLWLFILVVLLSIASIAVVLLVVWLKCVKRSSRLKRWPSGTCEEPVRRGPVRKSQIVRVSWNNPLTRNGFRLAENRRHSRSHSYQWPEIAYSGESSGDDQKSVFHHSMLVDTRAGDDVNNFPLRSWSALLENQSNNGSRESVHGSTDEEYLRSSYISDCTDLTHGLEIASSKLKMSEFALPMLDSPAPLSPITPLTLPLSPQITALRPTSSQLLPQYAALPPLPAKVYRASTYRKDPNFRRSLQQRHSTRLNLHQYPLECRSSDPARDSFLQARSSTYRDWLVYPNTQLGSTSTKPDLPKTCHVDVVSIAEVKPELDDKHRADTPATILFTDSGSSLLRSHSSATMSTSSSTKETYWILDAPKQTGREDISWLIDL